MIDITNRQLRDITADALGALITANNPPVVFLRSGDLVRIRIDEHGRLRIEILRESHVCGRLARVANFVRYARTGETRHVPPPVLVVRDLTERGKKMRETGLARSHSTITALQARSFCSHRK